MSLLTICPSYRRPKQAAELFASFEATRTDSYLIFAIGIQDSKAYDGLPVIVYPEMPMVARSNRACEALAGAYDYIGWVADDNRFRTVGWDKALTQAAQGGVAYGNDVVSPGSKPSSVVLDARIVKGLGWLILPSLICTYQDDVWMDIGRGLGRLTYLPDVVVEHCYQPRDNLDGFLKDTVTYQTWQRHDMEDDIAKARRALRRK